ncbi:hypothetical protein C1752_14383 [Acaryochloris thomasi RCC1774]|uniref:Integrase catalytic domain-containing protein n=1 Tax=Acaryochloris thomasi RCC1774 TaxID=1764569 RepID=A0A2W1J7Z9_9CYAN|nr:IS21 family transposase [Acaryochloris thomasi]PZD70296.1 hypothetical protein C1752_14383 [Acaryochloris thomasi RCC1774]
MKHHHQGKLLSMVKFREIIRLYELGYNQTQIATSCVVARSTVQDYIRRAAAKCLSYEQLQSLNDKEAQALLGKHQSKPLQRDAIDFEAVHTELQSKGITLALLWQEGLDRQEWNLSYGQFCRRYNQWKGHHNLSMRQVHKAGEKLFVDYCGLTMRVRDPFTEEEHEAQIFVACLGASNYTFAEATPTQAIPHWLGSHQRALAFFGGVPHCIVPDNLKSGINSACRYEPELNRSYQEFAEHYGVAVIPTRVRRPRDKAKVEKAVQEVERQIIAPLRHEQFTSFSALNEAITLKLCQLNERTMQGYGMSRRQRFEQIEKSVLKPLPTYSFVLAQWKQATVNLDYHIEVEHHYYSVPYWFVRRKVSVKITEKLIEVLFENQRIAAHPRSSVPYRHTTLPEHMPPEHWAYKQQSKERFLAWAHRIGPQTLQQVEAIFKRKTYEEQAFRSISGVQHLATRYGPQRLEQAAQRANLFNLVGYQRLKSILKSNYDQLPQAPPESSVPPIQHDNLRGQDYYS